MTGLWQRHRLSLIGIPVALALAMLLSGQRLGVLWEATGPRSPVTVDEHGWAALSAQIPTPDDPEARELREIRLDVALEGVTTSPTYLSGSFDPTPTPLPDGLTQWVVSLTFRADPDDPLLLCQVALTDEAEAVHSPGVRGVELPTIDLYPCLPPDTPGPHLDGTLRTDLDGNPLPPRPPVWEREVAFVIPQGRTPSTVRVWLEYPQAAVFDLDPTALP